MFFFHVQEVEDMDQDENDKGLTDRIGTSKCAQVQYIKVSPKKSLKEAVS